MRELPRDQQVNTPSLKVFYSNSKANKVKQLENFPSCVHEDEIKFIFIVAQCTAPHAAAILKSYFVMNSQSLSSSGTEAEGLASRARRNIIDLC